MMYNINKTFILDIENGSLDVKQLSAVEQAIINETVFYEKNTPLTDEYGNTFIVPKGFKLANNETGCGITIYSGFFYLNTADDAFHSKGDIKIFFRKIYYSLKR